MGVVWLARDDELERDLALKFLPDLIVLDRSLLADLKRETKRSLELTHKNIVRIYDFVNDETSGCISMEYIDGDTLSNIRADREQKVFETRELPDWMKQLCEALDYAHNHVHVVHRDLKPANLMVNRRGDLKVADFGIARSLGDSMSMLTMGARGTSGTLVYMSPQQLDGERGSHLDDIYSLGATVYELLTSKPPFYSGNIDRQIHERIPPPMSHRREELEVEGEPIDELWEQVVAACLQKDPALRPQGALEIAEFLTTPAQKNSHGITDWLAFPAHKTDSKTPTWPTPPSRKTRPKTEVPPAPRFPTAPRLPKRRLRRAALAMVTTGQAIIHGVAGAARFVGNDLRDSGLLLIAASRAIARGVALAVIVPSKAMGRGAGAGLEVMEKVLRSAGAVIAAVGKGIVRGAAFATIAVTKVLRITGAAVIAGSKVLFRGAEVTILALTKETIRGTAITIIPALIVAACVWFFAIRTPPPKRVVAQPLPRMQSSQLPKVQASATPPESHLASIVPTPATRATPESTPAPASEGGLQIETTPAGATVIVDGSITKTSPATLSNLAAGKHHFQIVLPEYKTEEMDVEVKGGEVASSGLITLRALPQVEASPTVAANEQAANGEAQNENEQKSTATKKTTRKRQIAVSRSEKSGPGMGRQVATTQPPTAAKISPKPTTAPKANAESRQKPKPAFGEGPPGG